MTEKFESFLEQTGKNISVLKTGRSVDVLNRLLTGQNNLKPN
jgi:hypothetical protein